MEDMKWMPFDDGKSIGQPGSENGVIILDEELEKGARITLEENGSVAPFAITCGIYGWAVHTRFFGERHEATGDYRKMKEEIAHILSIIPCENDPEEKQKVQQVLESIWNFIERYP